MICKLLKYNSRKISVGRTPSEQHVIECIEDAAIKFELESIPELNIVDDIRNSLLYGCTKHKQFFIFISIKFTFLHPNTVKNLIFLQIYTTNNNLIKKTNWLNAFQLNNEKEFQFIMFKHYYGIDTTNDLNLLTGNNYIFNSLNPSFKKYIVHNRHIEKNCPISSFYESLTNNEKEIMKTKRNIINAALSSMMGNQEMPKTIQTLSKKRYSFESSRQYSILNAAFILLRYSSSDVLSRVSADAYSILKEVEMSSYNKKTCIIFYKRIFYLAFGKESSLY